MSQKKILLVEDDEIMSRMYKRIFSLQGYAVEVAGDGVEGYKKAKNFQPDLIFLDVMMPKMDGLKMLDVFKSDPKTKDFPIMMLTNLSNPIEVDLAFKKGVVQYLVKSDHDPEEVVAIAKKFLEG
jgi:two-component system, NtrC family, sensor kinase